MGIDLHLSCSSLHLHSTPASEGLEEPQHAVICCLLDWVQCFGGAGFSIGSRSCTPEIMIHVQDLALTVIFFTLSDIAEAVQAVRVLLAPHTLPAITYPQGTRFTGKSLSPYLLQLTASQ